jgi:U3 small nucleolar RNA-associated protein 12
MAGERIVEALEVADGERGAWAAYETDVARLSPEQAAHLPPPKRHPLLEAYDISAEKHVLITIEKIPGPALLDALLVLPFSKVVSLMSYLDYWAQRVGPGCFRRSAPLIHCLGVEHHTRFKSSLLSA